MTSGVVGPIRGGPDDDGDTAVDAPDLDLVTAGVAGPLGAVDDAAALASVIGVICIVVRIVYSSSSS